MMYVLGTAGHVDHGKSTLVQALTGIDPDRLAEEKERGMTIDLGFAWLKLPSGREVSIIDVPGHERFIRNMLAGVGGIDLALLVIAADEGVMPQTREHLAILDLLEVKKGIVVITKKDLADAEMLELVTMDIAEAVKGTVMEAAPVVATSATTREGLADLVAAIDRMLESTSVRRDIGKPRLPIDRAFSIKGFGTVVTGTLVDGKLSVGQEVEIVPAGLRSHIRGLQTHKRKADSASPGSRVAVNLAGVAVEDLERGFVVALPGSLRAVRSMDVRLRAVPGLKQPVSHNKTVAFYTGASECTGRLRLLDREELMAAENGWAQVILARPVPASPGDLFIIRSAEGTLGGGRVVDVDTRRRRRFEASTIEGLERRSRGSPGDILLAEIEAGDGAELGAVLSRSNLSPDEARQSLRDLLSAKLAVLLGADGPHSLLFSAKGWGSVVKQAAEAVGAHHRQFPMRTGMPKEELRSRLRIAGTHFSAVLKRLVDDGALTEDGALVRVPSHRVTVSPRHQAELESFLKALAANPYAPSVETLPDPEVLNMLIEEGRVVKAGDVFFIASAYNEMLKFVMEHLKSAGKITVAEFRDRFQTSRKYALAFLEHLDERKITRRVGDERVLR